MLCINPIFLSLRISKKRRKKRLSFLGHIGRQNHWPTATSTQTFYMKQECRPVYTWFVFKTYISPVFLQCIRFIFTFLASIFLLPSVDWFRKWPMPFTLCKFAISFLRWQTIISVVMLTFAGIFLRIRTFKLPDRYM